MTRAILFLLLCLPMALADASQRIPRSYAEKVRFARAHPCPATGQPIPKCRSWIIDHYVPLACARELGVSRESLDVAQNMSWQTRADAAAKDRWERRACQKLYASRQNR